MCRISTGTEFRRTGQTFVSQIEAELTAQNIPIANAFLKTGPHEHAEMFAAEAEGLAEIAASGVIRVPEVIATGVTDSGAYIALERLSLAHPGAVVERQLGEQLAALHAVTGPQYGWHRDNTIGMTPQCNTWCDDWVAFFREHRLEAQLQLAAANGFGGKLQGSGEKLLACLPVFFEAGQPPASLLHGDLWGGNWGSSDGAPVIFDPAVYYGDRETDLAMTRLFGGFGRAFYDAYQATAPLPQGSEQRQNLYQLYHVLNHLNLFGAGYLGRAQALIDKLLQEAAMRLSI